VGRFILITLLFVVVVTSSLVGAQQLVSTEQKFLFMALVAVPSREKDSPPERICSGVFVNVQGKKQIITLNHCTGKDFSVVLFKNKQVCPATKAKNLDENVALLDVAADCNLSGITAIDIERAKIADKAEVSPGSIAVGSKNGINWAIGAHCHIDSQDERWLTTDCLLLPNMVDRAERMGSPLVSSNGKLLGVFTFSRSYESSGVVSKRDTIYTRISNLIGEK